MARQNIILQELREVEQSPRAWRDFGWVMAVALAVLAGISFWKHGQVSVWTLSLGSIAAAFALTGLIFPRLLKELHLGWMFLSLCLGWVMSRVILILLFVLVVIPTHFIGRVFNLSFMQMRTGAGKDSLWVKRKSRERRHHEKLF